MIRLNKKTNKSLQHILTLLFVLAFLLLPFHDAKAIDFKTYIQSTKNILTKLIEPIVDFFVEDVVVEVETPKQENRDVTNNNSSTTNIVNNTYNNYNVVNQPINEVRTIRQTVTEQLTFRGSGDAEVVYDNATKTVSINVPENNAEMVALQARAETIEGTLLNLDSKIQSLASANVIQTTPPIKIEGGYNISLDKLTNSSGAVTYTVNANISQANDPYLIVGSPNGSTDATSSPSLWVNKTGAAGDLLKLQVAGVNKFVVDYAGNVNINTTNLNGQLNLVQAINGQTMFAARRATDSAPSGDFITYYNAANNTALFRVDNAGNIYAGGISNSGAITISSTSTPQLSVEYDASNKISTSVNSSGVTTLASNGTTPRVIWMPSTNRTDSFEFQTSTGTPVATVNTTTPGVNVAGNIQTGGTTRIDSLGNLSNIGTVTSGLINSQTISSAANFTGSVTASSGTISGNNVVATGALAANGTSRATLSASGNTAILWGHGSNTVTQASLLFASRSSDGSLSTDVLTLSPAAATFGSLPVSGITTLATSGLATFGANAIIKSNLGTSPAATDYSLQIQNITTSIGKMRILFNDAQLSDPTAAITSVRTGPTAGSIALGTFNGSTLVDAITINSSQAVTFAGAVSGATTLSSGAITSTVGNSGTIISSPVIATTGFLQLGDIQNTSGRLVVGIEGSSGGQITGGSSAYASVFSSIAAKALELGTSNIIRLSISSAGSFDFKSNAVSGVTTLATSGNISTSAGDLQASAGGAVVFSTIGSASASKVALEFTSGVGRLRAFGPDASTLGGFTVALAFSNGISSNALSIPAAASLGAATLSINTGAVAFAGAVSGVTTLDTTGNFTITKSSEAQISKSGAGNLKIRTATAATNITFAPGDVLALTLSDGGGIPTATFAGAVSGITTLTAADFIATNSLSLGSGSSAGIISFTGASQIYRPASGGSVLLQPNNNSGANVTVSPTTLTYGGTFTAVNGFTLDQIQTATAGAARAFANQATLTAAANADQLRGMSISPSIAKGAFTGLEYFGTVINNSTITGSGTLTNAYQLYIDTPPTATNAYAIYVNGGQSHFNGAIDATGTASFTNSTSLVTSGTMRLANNFALQGRDSANQTQFDIVKLGSDDRVKLDGNNRGVDISGSSGAVFAGPLSGITTLGTSNTITVTRSSGDATLALSSSGGSGRNYAVQSLTSGLFRLFDNTGGASVLTADAATGAFVFNGYGLSGITSLATTDTISMLSGSGAARFSRSINTAGNDVGGVLLGGYNASNAVVDYAQISANIVSNTAGAHSGRLRFYTANAGSLAGPHMFIENTGAIKYSSGLTSSSTGDYLCINTSSYEVTRGAGSACSTSSQRFKENIQDINYGLSDVLNLRPVSFTYKPEMNQGLNTRLGFIAEEVQGFIPEAVNLDQEGLPSGVDYPVLTAVLTKAVRELNEKVDNLNQSGADSQAQISVLDNLDINIKLTVMGEAEFKGKVYVNGQLIIGSSTKPAGITLYDEDTNAPFCVKVKSGVLVNLPGECQEYVATEPAPQEPALEPAGEVAGEEAPAAPEPDAGDIGGLPAEEPLQP